MIDKKRLDAYVQAVMSNSSHSYKSLEEAYENIYKVAKGMVDYVDSQCTKEMKKLQDADGWIKNTGVQPVSDDTEIIIKTKDGDIIKYYKAGNWEWSKTGLDSDIDEWKLA